jgi:hypothetical protein
LEAELLLLLLLLLNPTTVEALALTPKALLLKTPPGRSPRPCKLAVITDAETADAQSSNATREDNVVRISPSRE